MQVSESPIWKVHSSEFAGGRGENSLGDDAVIGALRDDAPGRTVRAQIIAGRGMKEERVNIEMPRGIKISLPDGRIGIEQHLPEGLAGEAARHHVRNVRRTGHAVGLFAGQRKFDALAGGKRRHLDLRFANYNFGFKRRTMNDERRTMNDEPINVEHSTLNVEH